MCTDFVLSFSLVRFFMFRFIAFVILLSMGSALVASQPSQMTKKHVVTEEEQAIIDVLSQMTEEEREELVAFLGLDWKGPGAYQLSGSKSTLSVPEGYLLLLGEEAKKARSLYKEPPDD